MPKNKMRNIKEVNTFPNVFQNNDYLQPQLLNNNDEPVNFKGKWSDGYFNNGHPITLELACGKGDYTVALAERHPEKNIIGVDVKGNRIWKGAKFAIANKLSNVAFVRTYIEFLNHFFSTNEISEIWITFPDPYSKMRDRDRRLTSPRFLEIYKNLCRPGAVVHLKTDDFPLFEYSKRSIETAGYDLSEYQEDIYSRPIENELLGIQTYYEKKHLDDNRSINYLNFRIP